MASVAFDTADALSDLFSVKHESKINSLADLCGTVLVRQNLTEDRWKTLAERNFVGSPRLKTFLASCEIYSLIFQEEPYSKNAQDWSRKVEINIDVQITDENLESLLEIGNHYNQRQILAKCLKFELEKNHKKTIQASMPGKIFFYSENSLQCVRPQTFIQSPYPVKEVDLFLKMNNAPTREILSLLERYKCVFLGLSGTYENLRQEFSYPLSKSIRSLEIIPKKSEITPFMIENLVRGFPNLRTLVIPSLIGDNMLDFLNELSLKYQLHLWKSLNGILQIKPATLATFDRTWIKTPDIYEFPSVP